MSLDKKEPDSASVAGGTPVPVLTSHSFDMIRAQFQPRELKLAYQPPITPAVNTRVGAWVSREIAVATSLVDISPSQDFRECNVPKPDHPIDVPINFECHAE